MGFFEFANMANGIQLFFNPSAEYVQQYIFSLSVGGLCFLLIYAFQAIALYKIAKREGYGNKWMAFVPFVSTYYIGVCAQKNGVYKLKPTTVALIAAIFEILACAGYALYYVAEYTMIVGRYVTPAISDVQIGTTVMQIVKYIPNPDMPANVQWLWWMFEYGDSYIISWLEIIYAVANILILIAFFKTYACKNYIIYVIVSIFFPVQGILFFALRNNKAENFNDYVMKKQAARYRRYQQYYNNTYNNPYANGQSRNSSGNVYTQNPFSEFGNDSNKHEDKPSDPFDEFN